MMRSSMKFIAATAGLIVVAGTQAGVVLQDSHGRDAVEISFEGVVYHDDGTSSWTYHVEELWGGQDLSHWNLGLAEDASTAAGTTGGFEIGEDGSTGFFGIKWDVTDSFSSGDFVVVLDGHFGLGAVDVLVKCGDVPDIGSIAGPGDGLGEDDGPPPPTSFSLTGRIRDFLGRTDEPKDGVQPHPDFQRRPDGGFGHYMGCISELLDDDMKPSLGNGPGYKVKSQWKDADGHPIFPGLFDADAGDTEGIMGIADSGGIDSSTSFAQWFRDTPGVNLSKDLNIEFGLGDHGVYTFEDNDFFPIDGDLLGNVGRAHNYHFTFELQTEFTYKANTGQLFTFTGDDDVWVFVGDRLVIDIGGVHSAVSQTVDMDRLDLVDGETYTLSFFFAERHTTESHFRIDTTLHLVTAELPTVSAAYD
jgi:fibro-slime domain-containing protein